MKLKTLFQKEWHKLRKVGKNGCWDESRVMEKKEVIAKARDEGKMIHWGRIFEICAEKGSELPKGDKNRKFKGRVVFQGNNVLDQNFDYAIFAELGLPLQPWKLAVPPTLLVLCPVIL